MKESEHDKSHVLQRTDQQDSDEVSTHEREDAPGIPMYDRWASDAKWYKEKALEKHEQKVDQE